VPGSPFFFVVELEAAAEMVIKEGKTQAEAAKEFEISQPAVSKALKNITEKFQWKEEVIMPDHITHPRDEADFRKLSPAGQQAVRDGQPLNRVALDP